MSTLTLEAHGKSFDIIEMPGKICKCIRQGAPYEARLLEHVYELGLSGTAIDAGANIGNHSMWFAAICGLRVEAFEPIRYEALRANIKLNDLEFQVNTYATALGESMGFAHEVGKGELRHNGGAIPVNTLDSYNFRDVSVIKIDVEGGEPLVLRGAEQTILAERPIIYAEAWDEDYELAINDILVSWGYSRGAAFTGHIKEWLPG